MYWQYLSAVVKRAFRPARGVAELLQLMAALAIPALAAFAGIHLPTGDNALAYIGAAVIALIALRLLFVAPFQVWREQLGRIGDLELDLAKPERIETEHMATVRAGKRLELAALVRRFHWVAYSDLAKDANRRLDEAFAHSWELMGEAGVSGRFITAFSEYFQACYALNEAQRNGTAVGTKSAQIFRLSDALTEMLHGRLSSDELARRLADFTAEAEAQLQLPETPADTPPKS